MGSRQSSAGGRDARNEGGLAGVGETDQAHVGQEFQFEAEAFLIAGAAGFVLGGRLVGGSGEARVALAAFAAARHREAFAGLGEIVEALAGGFVVDHGSDGHLDIERAALGAGALAALAVTAALGLVLGVEAELEEVFWWTVETSTTSPPRPPSPPLGPPRGTNFSRRKARHPLPPSPAFTRIRASSMNMAVGQPILAAAGFQPATEGTGDGRLKGGCRQDCLPHLTRRR